MSSDQQDAFEAIFGSGKFRFHFRPETTFGTSPQPSRGERPARPTDIPTHAYEALVALAERDSGDKHNLYYQLVSKLMARFPQANRSQIEEQIVCLAHTRGG